MKYGRHQKLEQQYQFKNLLKIPIESVRINNVVLVNNAKSAEIFLSKIFPHYTECFIVSADGSYPENAELKQLVLDQLATNKSIAIAIFGADSFKKIKILSERILVFDMIIADCFSNAKIKSSFKKSLDEFDIIRLMMCFFDQWKIFHRSGNYAHQILKNKEYKLDEMGFLLDLIAPNSNAEEPALLDYQTEDLERLVFFSATKKLKKDQL